MTPLARRRNAVLSFLSKLPGEELETFVHLMLRGLVPKEKLMTCILSEKVDHTHYLSENWMTVWYGTTLDVVQNHLSVDDYLKVPSDRQIGFLFLLEQGIKILGFNFSNYIPILNQVVISLMTACLSLTTTDDDNESVEDGPDDALSDHDNEGEITSRATSDHGGQVRAMCLRRLSGKPLRHSLSLAHRLIRNG
jgi:hypothetical protein